MGEKKVNRKIRVEYFQVVRNKCLGNQKDELFDLVSIIEKAEKMSLDERTFDYYQERARLENFEYNKTNKYWYLKFMRLRQTKIPSRAYKDKESEPLELGIDEYIGEDVTALYDTENHILALQRNRDSLSSTGIEEYLNNIYDNNTYKIYLRPIIETDNEQRIKDAKLYRKLQIRLASIPTATYKGETETSFFSMINWFRDCSAVNATITMSVGRTRKASLDLDCVNDTVALVKENREIVDAAELSVKKYENDPVDTIDIFANKAYDIINMRIELRRAIDFRELADEIHSKYTNKKKNLLKTLNG